VYYNSVVRHNQSTRYLINEIVVAEESDLTIDGQRSSHYEMYIEAMKACRANTTGIEHFFNSKFAEKYFCSDQKKQFTS
jgi:hypothetical protein